MHKVRGGSRSEKKLKTKKNSGSIKTEDKTKNDLDQAISPGTIEPEETITEKETAKAVLRKPMLQVEDVLHEEDSINRLPWRHRTAISPFDISQLEIDPNKAPPGEAVTISFNVSNKSDAHSIYPVTVKIDNKVEYAELLSLNSKTTVPRSLIAYRTNHGSYRVQVNDASGKFTIVSKGHERKIEETKVFKLEMSNLEASCKSGPVVDDKYIKQKKVAKENDVLAKRGPQSIIDKVGDGIEIGLDSIGDGIIFPIEKIVNLSTAISRVIKRKGGRRH